MTRIANLATAVAALITIAACQATLTPPGSPSSGVTASPVAPSTPSASPVGSSPSGAATSSAAGSIILDRAPADTGCDSIGWPDDVERFATLTLRIVPGASPGVWAMSDTGRTLRVEWVPGFEPAADGAAAVVGPAGAVVAHDGLVVQLPIGANPQLGLFPLCVTPTTVTVQLPPPGGPG